MCLLIGTKSRRRRSMLLTDYYDDDDDFYYSELLSMLCVFPPSCVHVKINLRGHKFSSNLPSRSEHSNNFRHIKRHRVFIDFDVCFEFFITCEITADV